MQSMVDYAHSELSRYLPCACAVDFTLGQGNDTLFLSQYADTVYAFDIQQKAIELSSRRINSQNVHLVLDSHVHFDRYVESFDVGIFNLGYMPGISHEVTTVLETTQKAIKKAVECMRQAIVIVVYIGHAAGAQEGQWLEEYCSSLDSHRFNVSTYRMMNKRQAPYVITIEKR
ncbi:MAG: class I SAM-dependent methyltransferase [Erysipelotrichaceae bacterium]|nr:class I SAM-dependent methyltransferase [Erysipelotrichaceae bacterium]